MDSSNQLRMMVYASLFAALTAVGAFLAIPIGPVPIVLQNMFVYLAGLLLGGRWGLASVGVYLLAGASGLPVFAGGLGGISRFHRADRRLPDRLSADRFSNRQNVSKSQSAGSLRRAGDDLRDPSAVCLWRFMAENRQRHVSGKSAGAGDVSVSYWGCAKNSGCSRHRQSPAAGIEN